MMKNSGRTILKYLIYLSVTFIASFIVFILINSYFTKLITDLDKKTDNLYVQEKIYKYIENDIFSIESKYFAISATTTNKIGMELIEQEINDKVSNINEAIEVLKHGGILSRSIISNNISNQNAIEFLTYKNSGELKYSVEISTILIKIKQFKNIIEKSKELLKIRNKNLVEQVSLSIDTFRNISRLNKKMPSFFNRIIENINSLLLATKDEIKQNKIEIEDKKSLYSKLELLPIFITIIILVLLTTAISRRILRLSKLITEKSKQLHDILDAQENIVILSDGKEISMYNKAFVDFFPDDIVDHIVKTHSCICKYFLDQKEYFSLSKIDNNMSWIEYLQEQEKKDRVVKMSNKNFKERSFSVSIKEFKKRDYRYVISFNDISVIKNESKRFEVLATYDNLTKIYNRQKFNEVFAYEIDRRKRYDEKLSLVMFDIDHFKNVNDNYGHNIGDEVLINISNAVSDSIRLQDTFARWGGEEFVVLMPHTCVDNSYIAAQKIRIAIEAINFPNIPKITASFGVIECEKNMNSVEIFKGVDEALYEAKNSGRNRVVKKMAFKEKPVSCAV